MATKKVLDEIWTAADEARSKGNEAWDGLVAEADKDLDEIDPDLIAKYSGQVFVNSVRFFAELWLAPNKVAKALIPADDADDDDGDKK